MEAVGGGGGGYDGGGRGFDCVCSILGALRARMMGSALRGVWRSGGHHAGGGMDGGGREGRFSTDFGSSGIEGQSGG